MSVRRDESVNPLTFIGTLPPPVTGMTTMTAVTVKAISQAVPIKTINWSRGKPLRGMRWKITRTLGFFKSLTLLIGRGRRAGELVYYTSNSSWGIVYDVLILGLAKMLGYRIVLHHHVYSYLDRYDWRMALVNRLVGKRGAHVVHCKKMKRDFQANYPTEAEFLFVPPTIVSSQNSTGRAREFPRQRKFTLGFLSNLTVAKGLPEVLQAFERLQSTGCDVRLILAGPCQMAKIRFMVDRLLDKWGDAVEYRGPVYDEDKQKFYQEIDAFIFPTQTESWGIVLTEALSAGCPVVVNDRGCVSYVVQGGCGLVVPRGGDFVASALQQVREWMENPASYEATSAQAIRRTEELNREAAEQLPEFVRRVRTLAEERVK